MELLPNEVLVLILGPLRSRNLLLRQVCKYWRDIIPFQSPASFGKEMYREGDRATIAHYRIPSSASRIEASISGGQWEFLPSELPVSDLITLAARSGSIECLQRLRDRGARLTGLAWVWAAERGNIAAMEWLKREGAQPLLQERAGPPVFIDRVWLQLYFWEETAIYPNHWGHQAVRAAVRSHQWEALLLLQEYGVVVPETVFLMAAERNDTVALTWLESHGHRPKDGLGLVRAAERGHLEAVKWYLDPEQPHRHPRPGALVQSRANASRYGHDLVLRRLWQHLPFTSEQIRFCQNWARNNHQEHRLPWLFADPPNPISDRYRYPNSVPRQETLDQNKGGCEGGPTTVDVVPGAARRLF
jgi:hypothetical protein